MHCLLSVWLPQWRRRAVGKPVMFHAPRSASTLHDKQTCFHRTCNLCKSSSSSCLRRRVNFGEGSHNPGPASPRTRKVCVLGLSHNMLGKFLFVSRYPCSATWLMLKHKGPQQWCETCRMLIADDLLSERIPESEPRNHSPFTLVAWSGRRRNRAGSSILRVQRDNL